MTYSNNAFAEALKNMTEIQMQFTYTSDFWPMEEFDLRDQYYVNKNNLFSFDCPNEDTVFRENYDLIYRKYGDSTV